MGAYQSAKFAVEGFSEVLNAEVKPLGIKVTIIEPGAFRTEWSGSSMLRPPVGEDYDQTVGAMNRFREASVAAWPGDPARAAKVIVDIAGLDNPPLRLLLGSDALAAAERSSIARAAEAQAWAEMSRSTDFAAGS
jgi:NAD(P)-dependent dehydrogenase (short-subunit alcohol dehydrogenase family)